MQETPEQSETRKAKSRAYYAAHKEKIKRQVYEKKRERMVGNLQFVFDFLKDKGCVDCGEKEPRKLEFDHVRGKKISNLSKLLKDGASRTKIIQEIAKCDVRCANCHRYKTAIEQGWYCGINTGP